MRAGIWKIQWAIYSFLIHLLILCILFISFMIQRNHHPPVRCTPLPVLPQQTARQAPVTLMRSAHAPQQESTQNPVAEDAGEHATEDLSLLQEPVVRALAPVVDQRSVPSLVPLPVDAHHMRKQPPQRKRRHHAWQSASAPSVTSERDLQPPAQRRSSAATRQAQQLIERDIAAQQAAVDHEQRVRAITQRVNKGFADDALRRYGRSVAHKIVFGLNASRIEGTATPFSVNAIITINRAGKVISVEMDPERSVQSPVLQAIMTEMARVLQHISFDPVPSLWPEEVVTFPCTFSSQGTGPGGLLSFQVVDYGYYR